jgi:hypothetical protein
MTTPAQSLFSESLERSAQQRQLQMWQAAQTVRAHVGVNDGLASMLECLGLDDAQRPE